MTCLCDDRAILQNLYGKMSTPSSILQYCGDYSSKSQIPLRYPSRRQVRSWSQSCSELEFDLSSSSLAAS